MVGNCADVRRGVSHVRGGGVAVVLVYVMFFGRPRIIGRLGLWHRSNPTRAATIFCLATFFICLSTGARAQWTEAGPYTITSSLPNLSGGLINSNTGPSGMPAQGNPVYGAINTVLESPTSPNTYWAGTVGGGIWMTTDGGQTWKPKTDNQLSMAIGALALDSTDSSGQTVYAGTGQYSSFPNPFVPFAAPSAPGTPPLTGLLKSTNSGASWSTVASTGLIGNYYQSGGNPTLAANGSPNIDGVIASGNNILVAAYEPYPGAETPTAGGCFAVSMAARRSRSCPMTSARRCRVSSRRRSMAKMSSWLGA